MSWKHTFKKISLFNEKNARKYKADACSVVKWHTGSNKHNAVIYNQNKHITNSIRPEE